ncbi:hypothetical protein D6C77_09919 [Aureobasidium pullulans]|nr:hypothetical protein D6C77_09919 [Aureobasidium pullulans]
MSVFEIVVPFSIQHIGPETTYEILTSLILLYARIRQLQIFLVSISLLAYMIVPSIGTIILSLTSSSLKLRSGCPVTMLVILKLAIDTENVQAASSIVNILAIHCQPEAIKSPKKHLSDVR